MPDGRMQGSGRNLVARLAAANPSLERAAVILAVAFMVTFVVVACLRIRFPFEVSYNESPAQAMMQRRLHGQPLYSEPAIEHLPCLYPPLFYDISAALTRVMGQAAAPVALLPMRLVSVISSLGVSVLLLVLLRRRKLAWTLAVPFASVFLAVYARFECWHDNSRVDALMTLFLVAGVALLIEGRGVLSAVMAGIAGALSILTKQPALVLFGAVGAFVLVSRRSWARVLICGAVTVVAGIAYLAAVGELTNPWFWEWQLRIPASHPLRFHLLLRGPLFLVVVIPFLMIAALAVLFRRRQHEHAPVGRDWAWVCALWTVILILLRAKQGATFNFFMPLVPIAVLAAAATLVRDPATRAPLPVGALLVVQLAMLAYDPRALVPTKASEAEMSRLVGEVAAVDGPVWFPAFPMVAVQAGKPWMTHEGPLIDLADTRPAFVQSELSRRIGQRELGGILMDSNRSLIPQNDLNAAYRPRQLSQLRDPFLLRLFARHFDGVLWLPASPATARDDAAKP